MTKNSCCMSPKKSRSVADSGQPTFFHNSGSRVAATFNAARKSGKLGARARVAEVLPSSGTALPPYPYDAG
jgi:hypothetical protein